MCINLAARNSAKKIAQTLFCNTNKHQISTISKVDVYYIAGSAQTPLDPVADGKAVAAAARPQQTLPEAPAELCPEPGARRRVVKSGVHISASSPRPPQGCTPCNRPSSK